jgi:hypothetical protein
MDEMLHVTLAGGLDAPRLARVALRALNGSLDDLRFPVALLVSELVANAVVQDTGRDAAFSVQLESGPDQVHVEVVAGATFSARPGRAIDPIVDGFGPVLLDQLSDRWGVEADDETTVWFEIDRKRVREQLFV